MIIGYIPVDANGDLIKGGTRRFKIYASPALAMASQGRYGAKPADAKPVYVEEVE